MKQTMNKTQSNVNALHIYRAVCEAALQQATHRSPLQFLSTFDMEKITSGGILQQTLNREASKYTPHHLSDCTME